MSNIQKLKDEYIDHMMNPRNYGKLPIYDGKGIGKNPYNNELVEIYIQVAKDSVITNVTFQAIGCMSTVVGGSIFTDMVKNETVSEAVSATEEFLKKLVNAPIEDRACGEMVAKAFLAAVKNYENKKEGKNEDEHTLFISENCVTELKNETE